MLEDSQQLLELERGWRTGVKEIKIDSETVKHSFHCYLNVL